MNRRNFFRNLVIGAVSAPAIAKALAEESADSIFTYRKVNEWGPATPADYARLMDDQTASMQRAICEHIANRNPYAGLVFAADQTPLRFSP